MEKNYVKKYIIKVIDIESKACGYLIGMKYNVTTNYILDDNVDMYGNKKPRYFDSENDALSWAKSQENFMGIGIIVEPIYVEV